MDVILLGVPYARLGIVILAAEKGSSLRDRFVPWCYIKSLEREKK
jgi:hypothetical protein